MCWVGTWGCALYHGDDTNDAGKQSALRVSAKLSNSTLRQIIRVSAGGNLLRLVLSNQYGQTDMVIREVHIAKATVPAHSDIDAATDMVVTWENGNKGVIIPPGEQAVSDAVNFLLKPLGRIAVSMLFGDVPQLVTCHVGARANSFIKHGDALSALHDLPALSALTDVVITDAEICTHWFVLSGVDVYRSGAGDMQEELPENLTEKTTENIPGESTIIAKTYKSIVILGDSITDGFGVMDEQYTRWSDIMTQRLQNDPETRHLSVINMGIGTNKLLNQKNPPAAFDRFQRDVLEQPGIGYFMFLIGVNDLVAGETAGNIITSMEQMIKQAKAKNLKVCACTIMPYETGDNKQIKCDKRRHEINDWLRSNASLAAASGNTAGTDKIPLVDILVDFDELLKDFANPDRLMPVYSCDGLHPSVAAYKIMGEHAYEMLKRNDSLQPVS